jgi:heat shock protein HslJ
MLETVARYEVSGTELTLFDSDDNAVLTFGAQVNPFFSGTAWQLTELDGDAVLEDAPITLSFDDDTLGGSAGCNNYVSGYAMVGGSVALNLTGSTMAMCPDDIMAQESTYFAALAEVVAWEATDTELALLDSDGEVKLRFTLVEPE